MSKAKPIYKAKDGSEHSSASKADKHNELLTLTREFSDLATATIRAIGKAAITADGTPLSVAYQGSRCWWIRQNYGGLPFLQEESFYLNYARFHVERQTAEVSAEFEVYRYNGFSNNSKSETVRVPVSEMYFDERKAHLAFIAAYEERLAQFSASLAEMKKQRGIQ